ncbi:BI1-like protein [Apostasia shenzhenica]|uniref:BI1-like protein n=1 Tax=Apostasia shenzhenica TaxID=1088818 RepID=A0A2I0B0U5_9ASPA|nr:BI1-like protein [Apostasia shenzhenica]
MAISTTMNWQPYKGGDVEAGAGARPLYPMMLESPELRWAFIRKIYAILSIQMLVTVAVSAVVVYVKPISHFFVSSGEGVGLYVFLIIFPFFSIPLFPLFSLLFILSVERIEIRLLLGSFSDMPPLLLLPALSSESASSQPLHRFHQLCRRIDLRLHQRSVIFKFKEIVVSVDNRIESLLMSARVILESAILTAVVVISLTLYTFAAARRGFDFSFLGPMLFSAIMVLIVFVIIQLFFPMGRISIMIYGGIAALIFCGYLIYDTDNLIKRYSYDEYVWAVVALYLDIINLFLSLLTLFRAADI